MKIRLKLMVWMYEWTQLVYRHVFKRHKQPWGISKEAFLSYPADSLGHHLGLFYQQKGFDIIPKLENHDVFHLITETDTEIQDEVSLQFLLLGNGKISLYLLCSLVLGVMVYPEYVPDYIRHFTKGSKMQKFYHLDFKQLLYIPIADIRQSIHFDASYYLKHYTLFTPYHTQHYGN
ncbi:MULTISPECIES: Coq4 family protein [unclassified Sphingobacterium]|uniref:Coq4 family protein n=1 Tax=unclassified Sphingobacterium TaxID=2609468 RepID=UPI0025E5D228|nr:MULTISPECIES: Coq4 family protein [unclassified Sphingobacterium]